MQQHFSPLSISLDSSRVHSAETDQLPELHANSTTVKLVARCLAELRNLLLLCNYEKICRYEPIWCVSGWTFSLQDDFFFYFFFFIQHSIQPSPLPCEGKGTKQFIVAVLMGILGFHLFNALQGRDGSQLYSLTVKLSFKKKRRRRRKKSQHLSNQVYIRPNHVPTTTSAWNTIHKQKY